MLARLSRAIGLSMPAVVTVQPVPTDAGRRPMTASPGVKAIDPPPTLQARLPTEHAQALLNWLQGPGGRTGTMTASEVMQAHADVCQELDWELVGWVAVGRELRRLIGCQKEYTRIAGRPVCVYRIPPGHGLDEATLPH